MPQWVSHRGIGQGVTMNSRRLMIVVLASLLVVGLALSLVAAWRSGDWWGFTLNLGTELVGAAVTYFLFDRFVEPPFQEGFYIFIAFFHNRICGSGDNMVRAQGRTNISKTCMMCAADTSKLVRGGQG